MMTDSMRSLTQKNKNEIIETIENTLTQAYWDHLDRIGNYYEVTGKIQDKKNLIPTTVFADIFDDESKKWLIETHESYGIIMRFQKIRDN